MRTNKKKNRIAQQCQFACKWRQRRQQQQWEYFDTNLALHDELTEQLNCCYEMVNGWIMNAELHSEIINWGMKSQSDK